MKTHTSETRAEQISQSVDAYKPTMAQLAYEKYPDEIVTFELKNRRNSQKLSELVDPQLLRNRLARFQAGWTKEEVQFLASQLRRGKDESLFSDDFLNYLTDRELPTPDITTDPQSGELQVSVRGEWPVVTFWETIVMSEINELYFETYLVANDIDPADVYEKADAHLTCKIEILKNRPDIKFADFGTRRRFSYHWHKHVIRRLVEECPNNLIGTSNVSLAHEFDLMPIGTFAHEMPMVYAALERARGGNPMDGHREMLYDWHKLYEDNLSTALTDTFGSEFFFADFSAEQAASWASLRQDSGDPIEFGERAIAIYERYGIDPCSKTIVFSDGLDLDTIVKLADHFSGRINVIFGWGTSLTNDMGLDVSSLNIVMKAVKVNNESTVKLSDDTGKETGPDELVAEYQTDARCAILKKIGAMTLV